MSDMHGNDLYIPEYAELGIPLLCRLEDFPIVSRLYSPESMPSKTTLLSWWNTGHIVHQVETRVSKKPRRLRGRWVNVHQTLYLWRIVPSRLGGHYPTH